MSILNTRAGSVLDNIAKLSPGQSFSVSRLVGSDDVEVWSPLLIAVAKEKIASHFSRYMHTLRSAHPCRAFEIETGVMAGSRNNLFVVGVITRIADHAEL